MKKTVIKVALSESGINKAIREVEAFKRDFLRKAETYKNRIAEEIAKTAELNFSGAIVDDIINGAPRKADVKVYVSDREDITVIVAYGKDAVWCEFGAGVYHNGSVGSSPHPNGASLGFTIGSFGENGKRQAWGYRDESGELVITRGSPATMPMYNAARDVMSRAVQIAREVFV